MNDNRFYKRKWFHIKKKEEKKRTIFTRNYEVADYSDDLALLTNTLVQEIKLFMNANKVCVKQGGAISALSSKPLKLVDHFTYLGSNISFTCAQRRHRLWRIVYKSYGNPSDKIKRDFFRQYYCMDAPSRRMHHIDSYTWTYQYWPTS